MSEAYVDTGAYATHRGRICAEDYEFIRACVKRRVPTAHIAKMINRPIEEVRQAVRLFATQAVETGELPPPVDRTAVVLSLFRGLITRRPNARAIIDDVSEHWGVSVEELVGPGRSNHVTRPRFEAMHRLRATGRYSLPQIGAIFNRDHTTVLHACRRHEQLTEAANT